MPGEGVWQPVTGDKLARGYAVYTTQLRSAAGSPSAGLAWIDSAATRLALYAGSSEPYGTWPQQGVVAVAQLPTLLAAFNSGFKIYSYQTGWYEQGRSAVPLQAGAASLVIFTNGTATVADWGRDVSLGPTVAAVRQNLTLLVDHGVAAATAAAPGQWGAVLGGGTFTWRSGVGVTAAGDLIYAGGPSLSPAALARLLIAAGAVRAMELDINPQWVSFATFTHAGGIAGGGILAGTNLLAGMYYQPGHYLQPYSRDFFAVFYAISLSGRMTGILIRMTVMVSFRADDEDVAEADRWAKRLGVERSELLRDALASHIAHLAAEGEASVYEAQPFTADELALDDADEWGPAEDWSDWVTWVDRRGRAAG